MRAFIVALGVMALLLTECGGSAMTSIDRTRYGTWLLAGSSWTQLAQTSEIPPEGPLAGNSMGEAIMYWTDYGGLIDSDGTRWDGTSWVVNGAALPALPSSAIADQETGQTRTVFDAARDELLVLDPEARTIWDMSHGSWKSVLDSSRWPAARNLVGAAYDPARMEVLILSCCDTSTAVPSPQTWAWDGRDLTQRAALSEGWDRFALVPDGLGHLLAFGPTDGFSWDGQSWTSLGPGAALPNASAIDLVFDPGRAQVVAIATDQSVDVWRWQQGGWSHLTTSRRPPEGCAISNPVYVPDLAGIVITDLAGTCNNPVLP